MKPEAQRIAIAEACGFTHIVTVCGFILRGQAPDGFGAYGPSVDDPIVRTDIPDYLNDLNAMHEAEKVLKDWNKYVCMLAKVIVGDTRPKCSGNDYHVATSVLIHATAAQRAESFLRTLGKWVES